MLLSLPNQIHELERQRRLENMRRDQKRYIFVLVELVDEPGKTACYKMTGLAFL